MVGDDHKVSRNEGSFSACPQKNLISIQEKKSTKINFWVRISSGGVGVGVLHLKGWGPKSSVCPSNPPRGPNDQKKLMSIEIFNLDRNF